MNADGVAGYVVGVADEKTGWVCASMMSLVAATLPSSGGPADGYIGISEREQELAGSFYTSRCQAKDTVTVGAVLRQSRAYAEHLLATYPGEAVALQWIVTMAFYAALHCLTGYLRQRGVQGFDRQVRDAAIADLRNGISQDVYDADVRLKRRSTGASYNLQTSSERQVHSQILDTYLARIATFVGL